MLATLLAALLAAAPPAPAPAPSDPHKDHAGMKHDKPCCEKDCCKGEEKMDCCEKMKAEAPAPADHAGHAH